MKEVILVTGITGFLGCHIAKLLCENNYEVIGTRRIHSDTNNCSEFQDRIAWINVGEQDWKEKVIILKPTIIIHAAWMGVSALERADWELQSKNLLLIQDLCFIAQQAGTQKIIALGSQAEYGFTNTAVAEDHPLTPTGAYGAVKIIASLLIKNACATHNIHWYWLRVFSVFGEKEGNNWLLPGLITTIAKRKETTMSFSPGDQRYAYLYAKDFAEAVIKVVLHRKDDSGIYNLSSEDPLSLKKIITFIKDKMNPGFQLLFGALPYRENQSMLMAGDMYKFNAVFGKIPVTPLEESISNTIIFYTSKLANESI